VLAAALAATAAWSFLLLRRTPAWHPWLGWAELVVGLAVAALITVRSPLHGRLSGLVAGIAIAAAMAGPASYTLATVSQAHSGAIPSAGPAGASGFGPGRPRGGGPGGRPLAAGPPFLGGGGGQAAGQFPQGPGGTPGQGGFGPGGRANGRIGGLLNGSTPSAALAATLSEGSTRYTWIAAAVGSNEASGYQLATSKPVMAIGGFNGTDPFPTLAQFEGYVRQGKVHYFIATGGHSGANPTSSASGQITAWVESRFTAVSTPSSGGVVLYDLTKPTTTGTG
jgi:hypothetical protein